MDFKPENIFTISSEGEFRAVALDIFRFQAESNPVYKKYCSILNKKAEDIKEIPEIPFLPIEFFKTYDVITEPKTLNHQFQIFTSSGTSGITTSKHHIADISFYEKSFRKGFEYFYGDIKHYCILALLPSYLEREGSSLVYMIDDLIKLSENADSGFYLHNMDELTDKIKILQQKKQKTILLGVTYALLDFVKKYKFNFPELIVMETGGMKGKRQDIVREELHEMLC